MSKRPTHQEVEATLRASNGASPQLLAVLKALPKDVDPEVAARATLGLIGEGRGLWIFARTCRKLPVPVIHALLTLLEPVRHPYGYFLRESVPRDASEAETREAWSEALLALLDLDTTYAWGSPQRKAKLQSLADSPRLLHAIQTAVVACEEVSLDMLAVLAADASDASVDALIPHVERAATRQDWSLDRFQHLRTHARSTPAMDAMFSRMQALLDARRARSPALELARALGFGTPAAFWFRAYLASPVAAGEPAPRFQVHLEVDSRSARWFGVSLTETSVQAPGQAPRTRFTNEQVFIDTLEVGTCEPAGFPRWLADAARKLRTQWSFDTMALTTSVRGTKRDALERWLRGEA